MTRMLVPLTLTAINFKPASPEKQTINALLRTGALASLPIMSSPSIPLAVAVCALSLHCVEAQSLTWLINNTTNIGGLTATNHGNPQVTATPYGNAVLFDGFNGGLTVGTNPIAGATNFTVEMIFRPDPITLASAWQPRIFHIQSPNPPDHRLTLEARVTNGTWYADVFLRTSATTNLTLIDSSKIHSLGEWHHLAATFDGAVLKSFVDGEFELSGPLAATPMVNGFCSIGMRANQVNFFEGAVLALRFTPRVLDPSEFMNVPAVVLANPMISGGNVQVDFTLISGLPAEFKLLHAPNPTGFWNTNANAVLTTNEPGVSYRFTAPPGGDAEFYRVQSR
jgi:hypothetical protein